MKILTFNWHEAYICGLAKTGHDFEVVERLKGGSSIWFYETRPLPENVLIVKENVAQIRAEKGFYDLVICHNPINDILWVKDFELPKILIFHNKLSTSVKLGKNDDIASYRNNIKNIIDGVENLNLVFISNSKKEDWGFAGRVITPGIDLNEYYGYSGQEKKILRVGNFMKSRDLMMGYSDQVKILDGMPSTMLGLNEPEEGARFTKSWEDLKERFRDHRVYLNTTVNGNEDGYNLAMLEAMATGMPVVSTANSTSPIIDGVNGFISSDLSYLSEKIKQLLKNKKQAEKLGKEARKTVEKYFHIDDFVNKYNRLFSDCAKESSPNKHSANNLINNEEPNQAMCIVEDPLILEALNLINDKKIKEALLKLELAKKGRELTGLELMELHNAAGNCLLLLGKDEESKERYIEASKALPNAAKPFAGLGAYYCNKREYEKSIEAYNGSLEKDSSNGKAISGLGVALYLSGNKEKGFKKYLEGYSKDHENKMILYLILQAAYELGRFEDAQKCYENYIKLHPADLKMLFALAGLYFKQDKLSKSKETIDTILLFDPSHSEALALLEKVDNSS